MRRLASYVLVIAFALAPTMGTGVANAWTRHFTGGVEGGGSLSFDLRKAHGQKTVRHFQWENVRYACDGFSSFAGGAIGGPIKVVHRHFERVERRGGTRTKVAGTFTRDPFPYFHADGFLRESGPVFLDSGDCDTGRAQWNANWDGGP